MTGHIGERTHRSVALVTDDFRIYHRLAPFLEERGVHMLGLAPGDPVPASVKVLLNGPRDDPRSVPVHADLDATWLAILAASDDRPTATPRLHEVVVGVDPGAVIGLAVVADGAVYLVAEAHSPSEAVDRILAWRTGLDPEQWSIHVGDGAPDVGRAILGELAHHWPGVHPSLVSEQASSPTRAVTGSRHMDAAVRIALRRPETLS